MAKKFSFQTSFSQIPFENKAKNCLESGYMLPRLWPRSHYPVFAQKRRENLHFCERVHTDPHKNATKTEVFQNAVKGGYPQRRRFSKTHLINVNSQKWRFLKTLQYPTMSFTKTEQCERTKTDVFRCVFVIGQISVNAYKRRFFSLFLYENGAM